MSSAITVPARPMVVTADDQLLVLCEQPACAQHGQMHVSIDRSEPWFLHRALELTAEKWRLAVTLDEFSEEEWRVDLVTDGELDADQAAGLGVALNTAAGEAQRLNRNRESSSR